MGHYIYIYAEGNPNHVLEEAALQGYASLKAYYDSQKKEGTIQNDQLKVILLGNSTAGKTSLLNYWGKKEFAEKQTTTHGIYTPMELPLKYGTDEDTFRVNVWDFGGQDYYHATHRLFVTRDSTYILVCNQILENKPEQELTTEYFQEGDEIKELQVKVQHYPYRYWLQTLGFLTKSGRIDDKQNQAQDKSKQAKLFLVENKCGTYDHNQVMRLDAALSSTLPFEVINQDFFQLDIKEAWRHTRLQENDRKAKKYSANYEDFEEKLIEVLQAQIKDNRYEVHKNYPVIRDILASMAAYKQDTVVPDYLNQILIDSKIAPIESYEKLPVWITYSQYEEIVRKNSLSAEPHFESLHIYLQNLCGRIFHFKDIPALADIVFIDPNWLHQTIYKVLSQEVLNNEGKFTIKDADAVIDGNILDAAKFMEVMMAFDLVFEVPNQDPREFVAPQYLPNDCPLPEPQLKKNQEIIHELSLILEFPHYLPPSLISRIISQKGHLIKNGAEPLWRNGLIYTENGISIFILCNPKERKIEIYVGKGTEKRQKEQVLREFMEMLEQKFSDDIEDLLIELPKISGKAKWKHLYRAKKEGGNKVKNHELARNIDLIDAKPFLFLIEEFEKKPINIFVCYSHEDDKEMLAFLEPLKKELKSFEKQHGIKINPFSDLELKAGMLWDEVLQSNIDKCDILICLLSPTFFSSTYIQEKEYGKMKKIAESKPNVLIAPIYVKSCYIAEDNQIANLQFYKPSATSFNLSKDNKQFSFSNLIHHDNGSYIDNYVTGFVERIAGWVLNMK
ncbi:MAG: TIR domain-containing protein [Arcicella sp.]|jgi:GTPase SAR1 family protein|nr:TIR domain-containing protein [Arcicella sp.]